MISQHSPELGAEARWLQHYAEADRRRSERLARHRLQRRPLGRGRRALLAGFVVTLVALAAVMFAALS